MREERRRRWWGWGHTDEGLDPADTERLARTFRDLLGLAPREPLPEPVDDEVPLPAARVDAARLGAPAETGAYWRLSRSVGKSTRELLAARQGRIPHVVDAVAFPGNTRELLALCEAADRLNLALIPFGGGTSVTGGIEPAVGPDFDGVVAVDMSGFDSVGEIDVASRLVRAGGGILTPVLDAALRPHGLTLRHYPQSYMHTTLGGWIVTRSSGHYSTLLGKFDDRVAGLQIVTPSGGVHETRVLPSGSVGPDPNRLWIGSEGTLGFVTEAWVRVVAQPDHRRITTLAFPDMAAALEGVRTIVQAGLYPAHLRLLDPFEAMVSGALSKAGGPAGQAQMILGFEAAGRPVDTDFAAALDMARAAGGTVIGGDSGNEVRPEGAAAWRSTFFRQPFIRDCMLDWGLVVDTFETAIPWSRAAHFYEEVRATTLAAVQAHCGSGGVLGRTTHAYPDGIAFYFTFFGPGRAGAEIEQWAAIKAAATEAVIAAGGTASHHHAAGRDHAPWTPDELPPAWHEAFAGAKARLDPQGRLNPGVIFPRPGCETLHRPGRGGA